MGARTMRITVVGAVFIFAAAILVVLVIRALSDNQGGPQPICLDASVTMLR